MKARDNREELDGHTLRHITRMLSELGGPNPAAPNPYVRYFEAPFLEATAAYYRSESSAQIASEGGSASGAAEYLRYAEGRLAFELSPAGIKPLLEDTTARELKALLQRELIANHAVTLVEVRAAGCVHSCLFC